DHELKGGCTRLADSAPALPALSRPEQGKKPPVFGTGNDKRQGSKVQNALGVRLCGCSGSVRLSRYRILSTRLPGHSCPLLKANSGNEERGSACRNGEISG